MDREITISGEHIAGTLRLGDNPRGLVIVVHDNGELRSDERVLELAHALEDCAIATLPIDVLDPYESVDRHHALDVTLQGERIVRLVAWLRREPQTARLPIGLLGMGVGTAAVLVAAGKAPREISTVVCCDGRPDMAAQWLGAIDGPTVFFIGERSQLPDFALAAYESCPAAKEIIWLDNRGQRFPDPRMVHAACDQACRWFVEHLGKPAHVELLPAH